MLPRWLNALLVVLQEAWSVRRDAHIRFLKLQVEILQSRLPSNRIIPGPLERRRLLKIGAEMDHAVKEAMDTFMAAIKIPSSAELLEHAISTRLSEPEARMDRLMRREAMYEKSYYRAIRELKIMQAERKGLLVAGRLVTRAVLRRSSPEDG